MLEWLRGRPSAGCWPSTVPTWRSARFTLAEGIYDVLVDETSPAYLGGLADIVAAAGRRAAPAGQRLPHR